MNRRKLIQNEEAVSITLGFMLMFSVTVLVFSIIILSFYTLTVQSERVAMRESFDVLGSGLAIRITTFDTLINITNDMDGTVNTLEYDFSIPASIANEVYSVNITKNKIIIDSEIEATAWIPFNTSTGIEEKTIYSNAMDYTITFNKTSNRIEIKEQ